MAHTICEAGLGVPFTQGKGLKLQAVNYLGPSLSEPKALTLSQTPPALREGSREEQLCALMITPFKLKDLSSRQTWETEGVQVGKL